MIIAIDIEDNVDKEEVTEYEVNSCKQDAELSLHSATRNLLSSTIKLVGMARDSELSILWDGGSSNCFLKMSVA